MPELLALSLLRGGAVPLLCGGASCCFALYTAKVVSAVQAWRQLELPSAFEKARCTDHAFELQKHAAGSGVLAMVSAAVTVETAKDYRQYRSSSREQLGSFFASRTPFFLRPTVVGTAGVALLGSMILAGGARFFPPQRPALQPLGRRPEREVPSPEASSPQVSSPEASSPEVHAVPAADTAATHPPAPAASPSPPPDHAARDHELRCATWAKMLAACEQANTTRTRFHCDPQLQRWRASCAGSGNLVSSQAASAPRGGT